jgi:CTP:phosphocholine cytidylyltransferase-like protein
MKALILAAGLLAATAATAQDLPKANLKVVGG